MPLVLTIAGVVAASVLALIFSSLNYSLRHYSRPRLAEFLGKRDADRWFEPITDHTNDLIFITAVARQFCNILLFVMVFAAFEQTHLPAVLRYGMTVFVAGVIALFLSIAIPHAAARYAGAEIVGIFAPVLHALWKIMSPTTRVMYRTDDVVRRALGVPEEGPQEQIEDEILSAVDEGEKEGVVDEQERDMIESVIEFRDTTVQHIMTQRADIAAVPVDATLEDVKRVAEQSGHSRIPVYEASLDHIVGVLHARDLIKFLGAQAQAFNIRGVMRQAFFIPETKPLRDLLSDFRTQKMQIAVVLDEYGSTAGLVTLEDVLEELVGEMSDEHEPAEPAMFKRLDDRSADADAKIHIEQLNRLMNIGLPENSDYETLGGFLTSALSRIPEKGAVYEHDGIRYTILDAEPQRVKRVKIEQLAPAESSPKAGAA